MLLQFNVTNFMSFKNEAILSLIANNDKEHKDILIPFKKQNILPSVSIYGANASGKSNINKALVFAISFIRNSSQIQVNQAINVIPFLLDDNSKNEKSRFDFIFVHNDIKYEYGFTVDKYKVYEEYLIEYKSNKPSLIFERSNVNEYKYTTNTRKELSAIENKNTDNKLFLSTATLWNAESTRNAYMWFVEGIEVFDSSNLVDFFVNSMEKENNDEMKNFICKLLKNADLSIVDYDFKVKNSDLSTNKEWELKTYHQTIEDGKARIYELPFELESKGTMNYMCLCSILKDALQDGKTVVIDEIDFGLHPMLVEYIIALFNNRTENHKGSQLIFNTYDLMQLSLDQFRRDQIYFVEKDTITGVSDLYSLDEYSPRKSENIQKGYMQGRYGAIPIICSEEVKW